MGFNDNAVAYGWLPADTDAELTQQIGANVHRVTVDWRDLEPRRDEYHLGTYDVIYKTMLGRGIRPLFVLLFSPSWTWDSSVSCDPSSQDCKYPPAPAYDGDWREIAALLASRYPQAAGIEVWNEPNTHWFWQPKADPQRYTQLLRQAHGAIKAVNPAMPVITGGFLNLDTTSGGDMSLYDFTKAVYANGAKDYMDGIGFHPYPWTWTDGARVTKSFQDVRSVRDAYGDQQKPLWVTEFGITTTGPDPDYVSTEQQQADGLVAMYRWMRDQADVRATIVHTLIETGDPAQRPWDREVGFGVLRADLTKKLAFCALQREWRPGTACP